MTALRWGKTIGAYNKYKDLFCEPLPKVYATSSPLPQANYIRDALKFASESSLPGGELYGRVKITAIESGVQVSLRNANSEFTKFRAMPEETIFTLMQKNKTLALGYQFVSSTPFDELESLVNALGFQLSLTNNIYKLTKP